MKELTDEQYAQVEEALKENIELRKKVTEYSNDLGELKDLIVRFLYMIGFSDGKHIYPEVFLPEDHPQHKSPMGIMLKAITNLGQEFIGSKFSKAREKELEDKFSFIKKHTALIMKYGTEPK